MTIVRIDSIFIITLVAICGLISCVPQKVVVRDHRTDSVRVVKEVQVVERWRDTTIYIQLPAEVREVIRRDSSRLETSAAVSDARINSDGTLYHSLRNKIEKRPVVVPVKDTQTKEHRDSVIIREAIKEVPIAMPLTWWQKFWQRSGQIAWGLLISLIGIKLLTRKTLWW